MTYEERLTSIGIKLLEPFKTAKAHHALQCMNCTYIWSATPVSKLQTHRLHKTNGCPQCDNAVRQNRKDNSRANNIITLELKGYKILSNWDGRRKTKNDGHVEVHVMQTNCGHTFYASAVNLLTRPSKFNCYICGKQERGRMLVANALKRAEKSRKNMTGRDCYYALVRNATKKTYRTWKHIINPWDLPIGRAGEEGKCQLDHIISIASCFDHDVPHDECARHENLQVISWQENIRKRDRMPISIPLHLEQFLI